MITAIKENVEVLPGGIIQLHVANMKPHTSISVSAVIEFSDSHQSRLKDMIGKGRGSFKDAADADQFIRAERDSWGTENE
jgi:hypothetical protein